MHRFQQSLSRLAVLLLLIAAPSLAHAASSDGEADTAVQVVAFGDSLSAGYGVGPGESFPEQLQAALRQNGYDVNVINAGVSGDTTSGGLARLDWSVPENTDLVILELGANDALRGVAPKIAETNLDQILNRLGERQIPVLLTGMMAPPNMGEDYAKSFDAIFPRLAEDHDVAFYPFFLDGVAADPALNQADHMHPNPAGVKIIVERILPAVTKQLDEIIAAAAG
ncbi:arylesterase [Consotaella aegiceratis]|uniref:arylesterase n=1 Tax=Consotaella aegiceratis TaxID=3097961 RepID=UPI002F4277C2